MRRLPPHRRPSSPARRARGSVLVVVLVTILFAALLLARMIETSSTDLLIAMRLADRDRLRGDAYAALETTLAVLEDFRAIDRGLYAPAQGWADPLGYAGYAPREGVALEVAFTDESAKLSLPNLNLDTLAALLEQSGLAPTDARRVADALFGWMHGGHIAAEAATDPEVYEREDPPHAPPLRPLRSFDELAGIAVAKDFFYDPDGRPTRLWHDFTAAVSLYRFNATNLNAAPAPVLLAAGWDATQADTLQRYLTTTALAAQSPPYLRTLQEARQQVGAVEGRNLGTEVRLLRITVTAREGAAMLRVSALVSRPGDATLPLPVAATAPADTNANAAAPAATPAAGTRLTGQANQANQAGAAGAADELHYPYTVLELTEDTLPAPAPPAAEAPDAPTR